MTIRKVSTLSTLIQDQLMTTSQPFAYEELRTMAIEMLNAVADYDDQLWEIDGLTDLIPALFWHAVGWQDIRDPDSIALYNAASKVFDPGYTCEPTDPETSEFKLYEALNEVCAS